jgi:hypothetical protein
MTLLREGWCVYSRKPGERGGLATDTRSSLACQQSGYSVTALAHRQDVIDAVLSQDGPQLARLAANLLAERQPHMSARGMLSGGQKMMAVLLLACAVALGLASPAVLKLTIMTGFAALFLAVSLIRLASLSGPGHSVRNVRDEAKLSDEQLPVYTVLVPLFGEANVVAQIIGALKSLNYPRRDLSAVTEAMRVFSPDGECTKAYMDFAGLFGRRELPELCRQALAASGGPLDTSEIATYVMLAKGMDATDRHLRKAVTYKVVQIMRRWEVEKKVERLGKRGTVVVWRNPRISDDCFATDPNLD